MKNYANFNRILVTEGDFAFPAAGLPLYTIKRKPGTTQTRRIYNNAFKPKQPILWLDVPAGSAAGTVPETIDVASITADNVGSLNIGVLHSSGSNGIVDSIRSAGPEEFGGCDIRDLGAYGPSCALSEIKAAYPKCLSCDTLSVRITLDDNETRAFYPNRVRASQVFSYTPNCKQCEDCDKTVTADEYMCGLVDEINGNLERITLDELPYPGMGSRRSFDKPYKAVKLHPTFKSYCMVPEGTACDGCDRIDALTTFTINGVEKNFVGLTAAADNTKTLTAQLEEAAAEIQEGFEEEYGRHGGFVVLTQGMGDCCGIQMYVSTCDTNFAIAGLSDCANAIVPFPTFSQESFCQDCATSTDTETPTAGLAIIAKQDKLECGAFIGQVPEYRGRQIDIEFFDAYEAINTNFLKATLQKGAIASNFGTDVQLREYHQIVGGEGFDFQQGNTYSGHLGLPDSNSQLANITTADCQTSYCTYYVRSRVYGDTFVMPETNTYKVFSELNVPQGDSTTRTAIEALFTKFVAIKPNVCRDLATAVCPS